MFSGRNLDQIKEKLSSEGITWKFITERAPWTGGYWERLVRSVKMALRKVLGHALLTEAEMGTLLAEVEAKVNARPLTFVSEDPKDVNVLTPFHFLIGREHQEFLEQKPTQGERATYPQTAIELRGRWKYQQRLVAHFWKRWQTEYITTLSIRKKWGGVKPSPMVGDIVLVAEENLPRIRWAMGRVFQVLPGSDGLVRSVRLRTSRGDITRPVAKVHLLERGLTL
ncbi:hypothetical protein TTRE_0000785701 [Trichuris trichiura]|uniref:Integrase catalytic domain-containing protein n=1 Tax=Trichuris trichiura TaxID=36087 RepID=A0A077ZGS6_TRITR|nr:hypothetical protein TTRE_0000785701 [Trichuris trichiura]